MRANSLVVDRFSRGRGRRSSRRRPRGQKTPDPADDPGPARRREWAESAFSPAWRSRSISTKADSSRPRGRSSGRATSDALRWRIEALCCPGSIGVARPSSRSSQIRLPSFRRRPRRRPVGAAPKSATSEGCAKSICSSHLAAIEADEIGVEDTLVQTAADSAGRRLAGRIAARPGFASYARAQICSWCPRLAQARARGARSPDHACSRAIPWRGSSRHQRQALIGCLHLLACVHGAGRLSTCN